MQDKGTELMPKIYYFLAAEAEDHMAAFKLGMGGFQPSESLRSCHGHNLCSSCAQRPGFGLEPLG